MTTSRKKPWRKVLYENHEYEDNYTDSSFLNDLQKNRDLRFVGYIDAIQGAAKLSQQITTVIIFMMLFYLMYIEETSPKSVIVQTTALTVLGYVYFIFETKGSIQGIFKDSKTVLGVLVFGFIFSPLLHTLTDSISTDTIFSSTFVIMVIHLMFFDYGLEAYMVSKAISLNAAIFASICLSSRLKSSFHSFVLLTVAVECFVLLPIFLKHCFTSTAATALYSIGLVSTASYLLYSFTIVPLLCTYLGLIFFVNFVCPVIFVRQQKFKNNIHGPWDEAILREADLLKME